MRVTLEELLQKLGVNYVLSPYETMPWVHYDEAKGITCSAEVRMGPTSEDVEAEIQLLRDEDSEDDEEGEKGGGVGSMEIPDPNEIKSEGANIVAPGGRKQVLWMRADAAVQSQWGPKLLRINDKSYVNEFHDWEGKGCDLFRATIESLQMGEIPDFDNLIDENMQEDSLYGGGRRGRIGRKSPNIKPGQLLGMKK
ncbi:MAG: hypothetical protein GW778_00700 [Alphaproteobacteria bacterium]|nr:hypothetical protein [Alphaproteobacteria bacterium]